MSEQKYQDSRVRTQTQGNTDSRARVVGYSSDDLKTLIREVLSEGNFKGEPGRDATIRLGVVRVSDIPGEAFATIRESGDHHILDLTLPSGKDGLNGDQIVLGDVVAGENASATLNEKIGGLKVLDLTLPRGERGAGSTVPGSKGDTGTPGRDGKNASLEDIKRIVVEVLSSEETRGTFRGARGERGEHGPAGRDGADGKSIVGPQGLQGERGAEGAEGRPGKSAVSTDDIGKVVLDILRRNRLLD